MRRKRKRQIVNDEPVIEPHIGHITTPIEDEDMERVKTILI